MSEPALHTYPLHYPPGSHWAITEAWRILDTVTPGILSPTMREWLAGQIVGTLMRVAQQPLEDLPRSIRDEC